MNQGNYNRDEKDTTKTGSDLPHGDGTVSDEDTHKITAVKKHSDKPIGQDHSLDNYEESEPTSGVGAFEDSSQPVTTSIAHIEDEKGK